MCFSLLRFLSSDSSGTNKTEKALLTCVLQPLVKLERLYLSSCRGITDNGLKHLKGFSNLELLNLLFCAEVTDAGLEHVAGLSKLTSLSLIDTRASINGLNKLKQVLPKCEIAI